MIAMLLPTTIGILTASMVKARSMRRWRNEIAAAR
jgi:hypothetical protein